MTDHRFTVNDVGYWVAGSSHNTADEIAAETITLAVAYGLAIPADLADVVANLNGWVDDPDDAQWLHDVAWDAVQYLSALCPDGYYFEWNDGLVMRADDENEDY